MLYNGQASNYAGTSKERANKYKILTMTIILMVMLKINHNKMN